MNMKGKYLFCPGIFLAAAIMGASGCSARKLLPFDDKLVSSVDDDTKKEKAYMVPQKLICRISQSKGFSPDEAQTLKALLLKLLHTVE